MLEAIIGAALGFVADLIQRWWNDRQRDAANRDLGAARAEATLGKAIAEIADAQAQNNAVDRGGAADVLRGLRDDSSRRRAGAG